MLPALRASLIWYIFEGVGPPETQKAQKLTIKSTQKILTDLILGCPLGKCYFSTPEVGFGAS